MKKSVFLYRALVDRKNNICKKMSRRTAILLSAMLLLSLITGCENAGRDAADPAGGPGNEAAQSAGTASAEDRSRSASEAAVSKSGGAQEAGTAAASQSEIDIPEKPYHRDDGGVSMDVFAMDTYMTLLAYGDKAEEAVLAAAEEIHSLDALLSTGSAESEVSKLNAAGGGEVSPVVQELIERSQQLYTETGGLFDIAIYPIMKLWGFPTQDYHVPDQTELEAALKLADPTAITLEPVAEPAAPASEGPGETAPVQTPAAETPAAETPAAESPETEAPAAEAPDDNGEAAPAGSTAAGSAGPVAAPAQEAPAQEAPAQETPASETPTSRTYVRAAFGIPGMEIDLGGIAKGYTSARVMEIFREHGIEHGLVSLGGNVQTVGPKEGGDPWRIAIQDPESELEYLGVLKIEDKCVITSGGYERFFDEGGKRYHHIIDPRTGYPADSGIISATIISEDGALADGLSTSLFIMGKDEAEKYWQAHSDTFDYILEDTGGTLYVTEGAEKILTTEKKTVVIKRK